MNEQATPQEPSQIEVRVPCEVYSRIVGYLRPVQNWNDGKKQEFKERMLFDLQSEQEPPKVSPNP